MDKKPTAKIISLDKFKAKRQAEYYKTSEGIECLLAELEELRIEIDEFVASETAKGNINIPPKKAIIKFNNGAGALLCNNCSVILAIGFDHEDREHYCPTCNKG